MQGIRVRESENVSPEADAHPESDAMGLLIRLDGGQLLDGDARTSEARSDELVRRKRGERLLKESGLEPLKQLRESWRREVGSIKDEDHLSAKLLHTDNVPGRIAGAGPTAERRGRHNDGRNGDS
jgi:hypothetical protein